MNMPAHHCLTSQRHTAAPLLLAVTNSPVVVAHIAGACSGPFLLYQHMQRLASQLLSSFQFWQLDHTCAFYDFCSHLVCTIALVVWEP